jgi:hypothetical protein
MAQGHISLSHLSRSRGRTRTADTRSTPPRTRTARTGGHRPPFSGAHMDWRRAGSPTYGRRRSAGGIYSTPASPAHPLGPAAAAASPMHPLAARSKARAVAAMAHAMSRTGPRDNGYDDDYDDDAGDSATSNGVVRYDGGRSPLRGYGYGGRSPLHASAAGGGGAKDKYFAIALPKVFTRSLLLINCYYYCAYFIARICLALDS